MPIKKTEFFLEEANTKTDAEWLLANYTDLVSLMTVLRERFKQLSEFSDKDPIIESLQLHHSIPDCSSQRSNTSSKTETAFLRYEEILNDEIKEQSDEIKFLMSRISSIQEIILLHDAVIQGLTEDERFLVDQYYEKKKSLDSILELFSSQGTAFSKSTLRRKKLQIIDKVQLFINALYSC